MRLAVLALLAATACARLAPGASGTADGTASARRVVPDLDAARELDQQGVRAFRDERFADASRYFRAAYLLGGPSSELWNVARSRERMDDTENAALSIEQYLAQRDLSSQDRLQAEHELKALRSRPSVLTVTTRPAGAVVVIDGRLTVGPTPVSVEIRPGAHSITVHHEGFPTLTRPLEARLGRAVLVALDLAHGGA